MCALITLGLPLAACGVASHSPGASETSGASPVSLTAAQREVLRTGVRQMIKALSADAPADQARLETVGAFRLAGGGDIQACGVVSFRQTPNAAPRSLPYYVELETKDGAPATKRGQIGSDKLKNAKVTFMCRHLKRR